jgi:hypothetical protein
MTSAIFVFIRLNLSFTYRSYHEDGEGKFYEFSTSALVDASGQFHSATDLLSAKTSESTRKEPNKDKNPCI